MAKQSLFKESNPVGSPPNVPATLPGGGGFDTYTPPENKSFGAFITFARKDKLAELKQQVPGLSDGDAVLIGDGDTPRKLSPITYFLLSIYQFWCVKGGESEGYAPVRVWETKPGEDETEDRRVSECVTAALLILDGGRLIPATARFADGMTQGVAKSIKFAREDAADASWAQASPDHAASMAIPQPNLRFKTELTWKPKKSRGGFTYFVSAARIIPTSAGDATLLGGLMKDPDSKEALEAVQSSFAEYVDDMKSLII